MLTNKFAVNSVILEEEECSFMSEASIDHSILVETIGFLYDIPKLDCFTNKSISNFI